MSHHHWEPIGVWLKMNLKFLCVWHFLIPDWYPSDLRENQSMESLIIIITIKDYLLLNIVYHNVIKWKTFSGCQGQVNHRYKMFLKTSIPLKHSNYLYAEWSSGNLSDVLKVITCVSSRVTISPPDSPSHYNIKKINWHWLSIEEIGQLHREDRHAWELPNGNLERGITVRTVFIK